MLGDQKKINVLRCRPICNHVQFICMQLNLLLKKTFISQEKSVLLFSKQAQVAVLQTALCVP